MNWHLSHLVLYLVLKIFNLELNLFEVNLGVRQIVPNGLELSDVLAIQFLELGLESHLNLIRVEMSIRETNVDLASTD